MKQVLLTMSVLLFCSSFLLAQKDAPVAGHAGTLVDLLKKDYNAIDPELRQDELVKDRTLVIAVFKGYLQDDKKAKIQASTFVKNATDAKEAKETVNKLLQQIGYLSSQTVSKEFKVVEEMSKKIETLTDELKKQKTLFYEHKCNADNGELQAIKTQYSDNDFLSTMIESFIKKYKDLFDQNVDQFASSNPASAIQKGIPFIGGDIAFETFIDGLGRFLAKRIKEELTTYVIDRVKVWLSDRSPQDPLAELKVLLPKTTDYLAKFKADQVTNFSNEIKQYIEDDINHLLRNAVNLRDVPRIKTFIEQHPDIDFAFEALELIPSLSRIKYPGDYFTLLENSRNIGRWSSGSDEIRHDIANTVYLVGMLSRSLTVIENGEPRFAGVDFLGTYASEMSFYKLYIGFLRQQELKYYGIKFKKNNLTVAALLNKFIKDATKLDDNRKFVKSLITNIGGDAERVFGIASEIKKANKTGRKIGADTIYNFVDGIVSFSENVCVATDALIARMNDNTAVQITFSSKLKPYFNGARAVNEITHDMLQKKYATGLIKAIEFGSSLGDNNLLSSMSEIVSVVASVKDSDKNKSWSAVMSLINNTNNNLKINDNLKKSLSMAGSQLASIEVYYRVNFSSTPLLSQIITLKDKCFSVARVNEIQNTEFAAVRTLIADDEFKKLLISYYSNTAIDAVIGKLNTELKAIHITSAAGTSIRAIEDTEADAFTKLIKEYTVKLYDDFVLNGKTKESEEARAQRLEIADRIKSFLPLIPQRFNVHVHPNLLLLIHFVNDMAVAKDAEDVEKAIDAFALPAGSYAIKRTARAAFSINSYPGILLGPEFSFKDGKTLTGFSIGFTAPIGLSYSRACSNGASWGFFVPVFDIAAVTKLRLDGSKNTTALPKFTFENLLSPGVYLSYGLKKSPFSFNLGVQYGPELKEIQPDGTTRSYESLRAGVGLVLDVPLFNLHTKPRD